MQDNIAFIAADVGRLFRKRFDIAARQFGVTGPQWRVLVALTRTPGLNQVALAAWLEVETITTGRMIDRLEKAGLVERKPDPADRRAWLLYATPATGMLMDRLKDCADEVFADALDGFSEPEHQRLLDLLGRLRHNLSEDLQLEGKRANG